MGIACNAKICSSFIVRPVQFIVAVGENFTVDVICAEGRIGLGTGLLTRHEGQSHHEQRSSEKRSHVSTFQIRDDLGVMVNKNPPDRSSRSIVGAYLYLINFTHTSTIPCSYELTSGFA